MVSEYGIRKIRKMKQLIKNKKSLHSISPKIILRNYSIITLMATPGNSHKKKNLVLKLQYFPAKQSFIL